LLSTLSIRTLQMAFCLGDIGLSNEVCLTMDLSLSFCSVRESSLALCASRSLTTSVKDLSIIPVVPRLTVSKPSSSLEDMTPVFPTRI